MFILYWSILYFDFVSGPAAKHPRRFTHAFVVASAKRSSSSGKERFKAWRSRKRFSSNKRPEGGKHINKTLNNHEKPWKTQQT